MFYVVKVRDNWGYTYIIDKSFDELYEAVNFAVDDVYGDHSAFDVDFLDTVQVYSVDEDGTTDINWELTKEEFDSVNEWDVDEASNEYDDDEDEYEDEDEYDDDDEPALPLKGFICGDTFPGGMWIAGMIEGI